MSDSVLCFHSAIVFIVLCFICTLSNLDCKVAAALTFDSHDEFAEFEDPDDTFTVDLSEPSLSEHSPRKPDLSKHVEPNISIEPAERISEDIHFSPDLNNEYDEISVTNLMKNDDLDLKDDEEFEGLFPDPSHLNSPGKTKPNKPNLIIAKVPHHLTRSWDNFHIEIMFILALFMYILNFAIGRAKNVQLATSWFSAHQSLLESNFSIVGDDGQSELGTGNLLKESEHLYSLWCTGSTICEAMLIELRLVKRQCLLFFISNWFRPVNDSVVVKIIMDDAEMDGWIIAIGRKRRLQALAKDHQDLALCCSEKRNQHYPNLPDCFVIMNEIPEVPMSLLNAPVCKFIADYKDSIEFLFFSDQYTGPRPAQTNSDVTKLPTPQKSLIFAFRITQNDFTSNEGTEPNTALLRFVFYLTDRVRRLRLSKEGKTKSERDRQRAHDSRQKSMHTLRQEAAQNRRDERVRAAKERIMAEDDPEKARKLEESVQRKEKARKFPKMKMLKVK